LGLNEAFLANVDIECIYNAMETVTSPTQTLRMGNHVLDSYNGNNGSTNNAVNPTSPTSSSSTMSTTHLSQPGDVFVAWRIVDPNLMKPHRLEQYNILGCTTPTPNQRAMMNRRASSKLTVLQLSPESDDNSETNSPDPRSMFQWLYKPLSMVKKLAAAADPSHEDGLEAALDTSVLSSRVCEMMFSVPTVSVCTFSLKSLTCGRFIISIRRSWMRRLM
jgi:hypothetical protein